MRVCVVTTDLDRPEAYLYAGLHAGGFDVRVVCRPEAEYQDVLGTRGIPVAHCQMASRLDRNAIAFLQHDLSSTPCDLVYAPRKRALSNVLRASRRMSVRIVTYRGIPGYLSFLDPGSWLSFLHPRVDRIVCVSEAVRDYFLSLRLLGLQVRPDTLVTIPKGHDPSWYRPSDRTALEAFGVPPAAPVVGCVATMVPRKGIDVLIDAMALLPATLQTHLLLIGSVRDRRVHMAHRRSPVRDRIHLAGYRRDAAALAGALDVFVLPTRGAEGLPRAAIEAMAQRVPAIVTDVPGSRELVQDRVSGRLVPPGDARALGEAVAELLDDRELRASYGANAQQRIAQQFNIEDTVVRMHDLFDSVLRTG
ncbi:MAG: glycosyltransferase family 4 protein [Gemmatimonadales bacterium]|nr:glycosyltransferase family 4 protein [Gemmatimonadales bacterium]